MKITAGSDYIDEENRLKEENRKKQESEQVAWLLKWFYIDHSVVKACLANDQIITDYLGGKNCVTKDALETAWQHPKFRSRLAMYHSDEELRAALTDEIFNLIVGSPEAKTHVIKNLKYKTTEEIRAQRDTLKERKEFQNKTKEELREIAKGEPVSQWEPLPENMRSRKALANASPDTMRTLIRKSGVDAINKVLNQKGQ